MNAHKAAHGAPRGACADGGPSVSGRGGKMLLMVEEAQYGGKESLLRSLDELQPGGTARHVIPYREGCVCTLFQGEPAKSCLCSDLLLPSMLNPSLGGQLL